MTTKNVQRAALSSDLIPLRETLQGIFPILEADSGWYGSIYFERKSSKSFSANLKQTQLADQVSSGVVLRIYDGYTLFEQATDEMEPTALSRFAQDFAARVRKTQPPTGALRRPYSAPSWKDRLGQQGLEKEITSQIPSNVGPRVPVHFGVRVEMDPMKVTTAKTMENLKSLVERCRVLAPQAGMNDSELTFISARQSFAVEESIFIDRETLMSQTLYRLALTLITMSGSDRTYARHGGLGDPPASDRDGLHGYRGALAQRAGSHRDVAARVGEAGRCRRRRSPT